MDELMWLPTSASYIKYLIWTWNDKQKKKEKPTNCHITDRMDSILIGIPAQLEEQTKTRPT